MINYHGEAQYSDLSGEEVVENNDHSRLCWCVQLSPTSEVDIEVEVKERRRKRSNIISVLYLGLLPQLSTGSHVTFPEPWLYQNFRTHGVARPEPGKYQTYKYTPASQCNRSISFPFGLFSCSWSLRWTTSVDKRKFDFR